jgi:pimeloyl-ACP methyl ester carboxylesterase
MNARSTPTGRRSLQVLATSPAHAVRSDATVQRWLPSHNTVQDRGAQDNWNVAAGASPTGTLQCVDSWLEDFRNDVARNTVPTLIIHGDADRILPPAATARRQAKMITHATLIEIPGGPHGLCWTHGDRVNAQLVPFVE